MSRLVGWFAVFGEIATISSRREGRFHERIAPGAFKRTLAEDRQHIRVLLEHGHDPIVALRPLGKITELREDGRGAFYAVDLFDSTSYVREVLPALEAGQYGASFRFEARSEEFTLYPKKSASNPEGLSLRTLTDVKLVEFGPTVFPAYRGATASVRAVSEKPMPAVGGRLETLDDIPGTGPTTVRRLRLAAKSGDRNAVELVRALERGGRVAITWTEDRRDGFAFERGVVLSEGRRPAPLRGNTRSRAGRLPTRSKSPRWALSSKDARMGAALTERSPDGGDRIAHQAKGREAGPEQGVRVLAVIRGQQLPGSCGRTGCVATIPRSFTRHRTSWPMEHPKRNGHPFGTAWSHPPRMTA